MITETEIFNLFDEYLDKPSVETKHLLHQYYLLIEEENSKYNLTGFKGKQLILNGLIESILIFNYINEHILDLKDKRLLDIGSGAGFPILPYLIYKQNFSLTIHEPMEKRVKFLTLVKDKLGLKNIEIKQIRSEDSNELEKFDFISARAVSELKNLIEISHALGKMNATFCFLKSNSYEKEIENAKKIINQLGIETKTIDLKTFFEIRNVIVYYRKTSKTPKNIPRKWSQIIKDNLKR
ncbi:glucose-inhibited division protein B [Metamycoplasma cloacale]|uniref:Ribosomal RNA small subunit methyltransferase G n=1 Tax=Metamycoplasma cloacale TaxID=92401 RepID=A0A2Z4LMM6_9BACT|nr:16S rRNA (guanine(527)-N(7))-methyltransferase RsmG [Metamycoplasma cloacale]AWX42980.1 16S rRNA (guanine(527)-N(7))-methyltransferase RsmG [Metamycoplasma cloacale]VEU79196.1 glucose-inhibited division protein B [Metamycoplasma cloacale]